MELKLNKISKQYKSGKEAIRGLDEVFSPGIIGLLGPNGAGKSTLMNMIATLNAPTSGTVIYNGVNIHHEKSAIRKDLGYLPQDFGVFPNLSAEEFLTYIGLVKGLASSYLKKAIPAFLDSFNLIHVRKKKISTFSGGMRQRIGIIQALLGDPKIILLDEPTVGLDPEERINFRSLLTDLSKDRIILLSSHIVSDIETIADNILVMKEGKGLFYGDFEQAISLVEGLVHEDYAEDDQLKLLKKKAIVTDVKKAGDQMLVRYLFKEQEDSHEKGNLPARLEDVYMYLTDAV